MSSLTVVALSGYAGAGKDAFGALLVERHGFVRHAFADPLKTLARRIGWNGVKDDAGRRLLQHLGLGARDVFGADVWVHATGATLPESGRVVITDCRFPNEAAWVKKLGGVVVRISRPGVGPANEHESETALDDWLFDVLIDNNSTLGSLALVADLFVAGLDDGATLSRVAHAQA